MLCGIWYTDAVKLYPKNGGTMTQYLDETNAMPEYMPYPKFLLKMELTPTAKLVYVLLLDRFTLSKKNGWKDEDGRVYLVYTIENLAESVGVSRNSIKTALNDLEETGLIQRKRQGFSTPYRIYIMIPEKARAAEKKDINRIAGCENNWKDWLGMYGAAESEIAPSESKTDPIQSEIASSDGQKLTLTEPENLPSQDKQGCPHTASQLAPNNIILNPITSNHINTANERAWGEFGNVMLTEAEYTELSTAYPDTFLTMLDFLSTRIRDNQIPDDPHAVILRRILA